VKVFNEPFADRKAAVAALKGFDIICMMRERTPFLKTTLEQLPDLKLLITSGMRNASIDLEYAATRGVTVCGTEAAGQPTAELAIGIMLELARKIGYENNRMKSACRGSRRSASSLPARRSACSVRQARHESRRDRQGDRHEADRVERESHRGEGQGRRRDAGVEAGPVPAGGFPVDSPAAQPAHARPRHGKDLALMKPTAFLINTSRGPIVDEPSLLAALGSRKIAGAGLDTFDVEPLPVNHPLRKLDNVVLTPHLGYVSQEGYKVYYTQMVDDIRQWLREVRCGC
jgi:D-3-phosphoglycerate dehydrogenase